MSSKCSILTVNTVHRAVKIIDWPQKETQNKLLSPGLCLVNTEAIWFHFKENILHDYLGWRD